MCRLWLLLRKSIIASSLFQGIGRPFEETLRFSASESESNPATALDSEDEDKSGTDSPWEISDDGNLPGLITTDTTPAKNDTRQVSLEVVMQKQGEEMPQLLESIKFTVNCLYRMPLRRLVPFDCLKQQPLAGTSLRQHYDVLYVKDKFPALDPTVATRLGRTISRRRELLLYRHTHPENLQLEQLPSIPETTLTADSSSSGGSHKRLVMPEVVHGGAPTEIGASHAATTQHTLHSGETIFHFNAPRIGVQAGIATPSVSGSIVSSGSTTGDLRVDVPSRPKGEDDKYLDHFECPYCRMAQFIKTDRAWK
jgi:hypothetical protein